MYISPHYSSDADDYPFVFVQSDKLSSCRDEGSESLDLLVSSSHRLPVDAQCERGVGVAHFVHDNAGVFPECVEDAGEGTPQRMGRQFLRQRR